MKVKCIDNKDIEDILKVGKIYDARDIQTHYYHVVTDNGEMAHCYKTRFVEVEEISIYDVKDNYKKACDLIGKKVKRDHRAVIVNSVELVVTDYLPCGSDSLSCQDFLSEFGYCIVIKTHYAIFPYTSDVVEVKVEVKLNDDYTAVIDGDEVIVGCQRIKTDVVLELANKIKELKN